MPKATIEKLQDPKYFIESFFWVINKQSKQVPLVLNRAQNIYYLNRTNNDLILKARKEGFCLDPETRILTSDLYWIKIKDARIGQTLVSVEENIPGGRGKGRKMLEGIVEAKRSVLEPAFELGMSNGLKLIATGQHRFLTKRHGGSEAVWRTVETMGVGEDIRYITKPWDSPNVEDYWFSGLADGEGCLRIKRGSVSLNVCQTMGVVWDRLVRYVKASGLVHQVLFDKRKYYRYGGKDESRKLLGRISFSRMNELFCLIGKTRPTRFIGTKWWEGRDLPGKRSGEAWAKVVSIKPLPAREMIDLQTSTKTFIAEGFVSHNSTLIEAIFIHSCIFGKNENCVTMAQTLPDTIIHLDRIKFFLSTLGLKEFKFEVNLDKENQHELFFPGSNSRYWIGTAGSATFGRGRDISKLHLSEVAHYENQGVLTGILEACIPGAYKVLETTANGVGEAFHGLWKEAKDAQSGSPWRAHFFSWFDDPLNSTPIPYGFTFRMTELESKMKNQYKLTNEQILWYRNKRASMTDKALMPQEHPSNDQEAFLSSGRHAFDLQKIQEKKLRCRLPLHIGEVVDDGKEITFRTEAEGRLKVWKLPRVGRRYLVSADIAEGIQGGDYSRLDVLDRASYEQVATWRGHMNPGDFGRMLVSLAIFYENAVLIPEQNNHGWATIEAIKAERYPHLLKTTVLWKDEPEREGFPHNERTRNQTITALRNANDDDSVFINDPQTLDEMETFVQNERTGKFEAQKGCHDDSVTSLAIGAYCLNFLTVDESYGPHVKRAHGSPIAISSMAAPQRAIGGHRRRTGY